MAKVLLGRSDYKDAVKHFAGEFARDPDMAKPYTAAVFEEMAKSAPKQAMQFAGQMKAAGLVEEKKAEPAPAPTPAPAPAPAPAPKPEPETKPGTTEGNPGLGGAVGVAAGQTDMPTVTKNGGIAGGGKSGKATSRASKVLRDVTGGSRAKILKPFTGTKSVGGSLARTIPFLGTFATFLDFLNFMDSEDPPPPSA